MNPDGGGIRGYSTLLILEQLMREVSHWEKKLEEEEGHIPGAPERNFDVDELLPCHYFDFMYGTSTGGLIATMLGRLRMSVPQCLEIYREVGNELFGKRRSRVPLTTKYHHKPLENAVKKIVRTYCKVHKDGCLGDDLHPWHLEDDIFANEDEETGVDRICQTYEAPLSWVHSPWKADPLRRTESASPRRTTSALTRPTSYAPTRIATSSRPTG